MTTALFIEYMEYKAWFLEANPDLAGQQSSFESFVDYYKTYSIAPSDFWRD